MRAYIHIGMDKTGTTYLQQFCFENRALLGKVGLHYPLGMPHNPFTHVEFAHAHGFGWHTDATDASSQAAAAKFQEFDPTQTLLLSSEAFALDIDSRLVRRLKTWLIENGYDDIYIVAFVRNQIDFFIGIYSEAIKWGNKLPAAEFYNMCRSRLAYWGMLQTWCEVFGQDRVVVKSYDHAKPHLGTVFFSTMGVSEPLQPHLENYLSPFSNASPPQLLLEFIRTISVPLERSELYDFVVYRFARAQPQSLRSLARMQVWPLPDRLVEDLAAYDEENATLATMFGFEPFGPLQARAERYSASVTRCDPAQTQLLATLLIADMR